MTDNIVSFGKNAGKIWKTLNNNGPLEQDSLLNKTKLDENTFFIAVGWLARENKIKLDDNIFNLGDTNLSEKIGLNAGKVWQVLHIWEHVDLSSISRLARINEKDVLYALGWLARENKIDVIINRKKGKQVLYQLR